MSLSAFQSSCIVLACVLGGGLLGMGLRRCLPDDHLTSDAKDVVKLGVGLLATLTALVLGLLIASAKGTQDTSNTEVKQLSASLVLLERVLEHYGPEANEARDLLRKSASLTVSKIWLQPGSDPAVIQSNLSATADALFTALKNLQPQDDAQRTLRAQAVQISTDLGRTSLLLEEQGRSSIPMPFLVVLVCWVAIIFGAFGLLAPRNPTVVAVLLLCAVSISGAVFLVLEFDQPFDGLVQISSAPLRDAIARLGR